MSDFIMYADGFFGEVYDNIPHPTKPAIRIFKVRATPLLEKAKKLDINDSIRDRLTGTYEKEYSSDLLFSFDRGTYGSSYFALFDWDGKKCEQFVEELVKKVLKMDIIEWLRRRNEIKNLQNIQMIKDAREITSQPEPYRKQFERELIKLHSNTEGEGKSEEQEQRTGGQY